MTNVQAALGCGQLEMKDTLVNCRINNAKMYTNALQEIPGIVTPPKPTDRRNVYWMYGILIEKEFGMSRDKVMEKLKEQGIQTRTFFYPIHMQPSYDYLDSNNCPVAKELYEKGLYLPSSTDTTVGEFKTILSAIKNLKR
jgi:perosamine synthetase